MTASFLDCFFINAETISGNGEHAFFFRSRANIGRKFSLVALKEMLRELSPAQAMDMSIEKYELLRQHYAKYEDDVYGAELMGDTCPLCLVSTDCWKCPIGIANELNILCRRTPWEALDRWASGLVKKEVYLRLLDEEIAFLKSVKEKMK